MSKEPLLVYTCSVCKAKSEPSTRVPPGWEEEEGRHLCRKCKQLPFGEQVRRQLGR